MLDLAEEVVLSVSGLATHFRTEDGVVRSVDGVDFELRRGETIAIVGESGSGKSVGCLSLLRLVDPPGRIVAGRALFRRKDGSVIDLVAADERTMRSVRGDDIAMIFQEPMTSLNPLFTVGDQIAEAVEQHRGVGRSEAWRAAVDALRAVGIADPDARAHDHPHSMSGGMRQRVMIAMALACRPAVLIADEPTTALDVTIQAQILDLMRGLKTSAAGMSIVFVTHNMGVVAEMADRVIVMYAGRVVESAPVAELFAAPKHPYTRGLLASIPRAQRGKRAAREPLAAIGGNVPNPLDLPTGCAFAPRCEMAEDSCRSAMPPLEPVAPGRLSRCRLWRKM
jgi:oligopeptide/dipeptide ABC transporter ATP-binding protein